MKRKLIRSGILFFCLLLPFIIWRLWLAYDVGGKLAAIRAAGLPANARELDRWYATVPERENAALVLTKAFTLRTNYPDNRSNLVWHFKLPGRRQALTPDQTELLAGYVELNAPMLVKADEALKLSASRYPIDCSLCGNTPLPHLAWLKGITTLNQYRAVLAIEAGQPERASTNIQTMLGIARTLEGEPILISQLVRLKIFKIAVATLERRLNAGMMATGEITCLSSAFARSTTSNQTARALAGERAMYATYFQMTQSEVARLLPPAKDAEQEQSFPRHRSPALRLIGFYDLDLGYFLFAMQKGIEHANLPPPENVGAANYLRRAGDVAEKRHWPISSMVLDAMGWGIMHQVEGEAYLRLATTALAVEQFRNQHGNVPESLEALTPEFMKEVPEDPFTGMDLQYRRLDKGYCIYSVGPDRKDDHGLEAAEKKKSSDGKSYDLTFIVER